MKAFGKTIRTRPRSVATVALLLASWPLLCGCALVLVAGGAAAGAGAAIYYKGKLQQSFRATLPHTYRAARKALKEMELPILTDRVDSTTGVLESEYADGKHVWVNLVREGPQYTKVTVRVSLLGDEPRAREIMDRIAANL